MLYFPEVAGFFPFMIPDKRMYTIDALFFTIVERGKANKILQHAQEMGAEHGTIILGHGTSRTRFIATRHLGQRAKEVLMISADSALASRLHAMVASTFSLAKRHKGIAFTVPFSEHGWGEPASEPLPYQLIVTIVERGQRERCVQSARNAGAKGGTVISGRGAGIPAHYYVDLEIEPQKDIVLVLAPTARCEAIKQHIIADLGLQSPGTGMIFSLGVQQTTGLVEEHKRGRR